MTIERLNPRACTLIALAVALLVGSYASAISPPTAAAQSPAICDQYPNLPQCQVGPGGGGGDDDVVVGPTAGFGGGDGGAGAGELPFTGYPLNALILLLLGLLALGMATRSYLALRERFRTRASHETPS